MGQTGAINAKSSCHEVASELFATNARETHHGTLNSCFVAFRNVWVNLGTFCSCKKLGAKWAELVQLMQNFMFWCIWDHFVCALNSMQMGPSGAINAKDRASNSRQIFSQ